MNAVFFRMFVLSLIISISAAPGFAEDMDPMAAGGEMSEEEMAMQKKMTEYTMVNENHDVLKALTGTWNTHVQYWMDPAGEPMESDGTSEGTLIMGGRFLEQRFSGDMMGQPFEGRGIYGYDNLRKEYTGIWFDNFATGIMVSASQYDSVTKVFNEEGSMSCPITDETHRSYRAVTTFTDADHYTYETYMKDPAGNEFKSMKITYTRAE
ncbi:MAG: DUF1579 domain-containing protein [Candidatus Omnitrophota bacterium]